MSVFSTCCLHNLRSFLTRDEELTVLSQSSLRNQHLCKVSTISDLQDVLRISRNNLATSFPVLMMLNSEMWR